MSTPHIIIIVVAAVTLLLLMVLKLKISAFISLLVTSMFVGILAGMPLQDVLKSIQEGMGDTLGFVAVVVGLGAIGLEMAQSFSRLGVKVTGFDALHTVGGISDPEVAKAAWEIMGTEFPVHLGSTVKLQGRTDGRVKVSVAGSGTSSATRPR